MFKQLLDKYANSGSWLIFNMTETMLIQNAELAKPHMIAIPALGEFFTFENIGVPYPSLNNICHLPTHELKVDKPFVDDFVDDIGAINRNVPAVNITFQAASAMCLIVAAGVVETATKLDNLAKSGSQFIQGY